MASKLTKPITRQVLDVAGKPLIVTLTVEGILFRRPRHKDQYLLPYGAGETRAQILASGSTVGMASDKPRRAGTAGKPVTKVSRGLLTT